MEGYVAYLIDYLGFILSFNVLLLYYAPGSVFPWELCCVRLVLGCLQLCECGGESPGMPFQIILVNGNI